MKKLVLLSAFLISLMTWAQVPQGISYQAIALNSSGTPVVSSNVRVKLSILDNTATGTTLYVETHLKTTNAQGLFNLVIGQGTVVSGTFNTINWGTNSKFLKVEMDATGGTTYALVGTTQLLSVPYALAADSLVTSAGEGITLVSPNGTPYQLTVDNSGNLSLPTSGTTGILPDQLYLYGSFNSFTPATALLMQNNGNAFYGYKYFTAGTTLKFLNANTAGSLVYGVNGLLELVPNGANINIASNGIYLINVDTCCNQNTYVQAIAPKVFVLNNGSIDNNGSSMSYNAGTNTLSVNVTGITNVDQFYFSYNYPGSVAYFGDNLGDGSVEYNGTPINFPGVTSTPKNYRIDYVMNFSGSGTYTITQI